MPGSAGGHADRGRAGRQDSPVVASVTPGRADCFDAARAANQKSTAQEPGEHCHASYPCPLLSRLDTSTALVPNIAARRGAECLAEHGYETACALIAQTIRDLLDRSPRAQPLHCQHQLKLLALAAKAHALAHLAPLSAAFRRDWSPLIEHLPMPVESIQHPLSVYGELLEVAA